MFQIIVQRCLCCTVGCAHLVWYIEHLSLLKDLPWSGHADGVMSAVIQHLCVGNGHVMGYFLLQIANTRLVLVSFPNQYHEYHAVEKHTISHPASCTVTLFSPLYGV